MATVSVELGAAYCTLFTDDVAPEVNLDTLHHVTAYSKLLLNSVSKHPYNNNLRDQDLISVALPLSCTVILDNDINFSVDHFKRAN